MKVKDVPQSKLVAVVALLSEHVPGLTQEVLIAALKLYDSASAAAADIEPGQLLTVAEVAQRLSVCRRTVWNWIQDGKIRTVHLGKHLIRIPEACAVEFALSHRQP